MRVCLALMAMVLAVLFNRPGPANAQCDGQTSVQCPAAAATLNQRVQKLEKKTDYFQIKRIAKKKTWKNVKIAIKGGVTRSTSERLVANFAIDGTDPVVANAWVHLTGTYTADTDFEFVWAAGAGPPRMDSLGAAQYCQFFRHLPGGSGTIDQKALCPGVLNLQMGDAFKVVILFFTNGSSGTVTMDSLTVAVRLVNQVITEPPP